MPDTTRTTLIAEAKALLHHPRSGALATMRSGAPFNSLVTFATDYDGSPIFLLSTLAIHTQNLMRDPRCSLLLARSGKGDPLAHPRLTVTGTATVPPYPSLTVTVNVSVVSAVVAPILAAACRAVAGGKSV